MITTTYLVYNLLILKFVFIFFLLLHLLMFLLENLPSYFEM